MGSREGEVSGKSLMWMFCSIGDMAYLLTASYGVKLFGVDGIQFNQRLLLGLCTNISGASVKN